MNENDNINYVNSSQNLHINQNQIFVNNNPQTNLNTPDGNNLVQNKNYDKITLYDLNSPKPIENMPYIFCPSCKNKVIADSKFCSTCGYQISRR